VPNLNNGEEAEKESDRNVVEYRLNAVIVRVRVNSKEDCDLGKNQHQIGEHL